MEELLHELQVHQIELEMQNEQLRQSLIALEESRDRYVDLYEFAPAGYLTLNCSGCIEKANLTASTLLGVTRKRLQGRRFAHLVGAEDRERWERLFVSTMRDPENNGSSELKLLRGDSSPWHARLNCLCVKGEDGARRARITLSDISCMKEAQLALEFSNRELVTFAYSISHDLRAPIRSIEVFGHVLLEEFGTPLGDAGKELLGRIFSATRRMDGIIDGLLRLSSLKRAELQRTPVDLSALAKLVATELAEQQPGRSVGFIIHPGIFANADANMLGVLLRNLFSNAWKFTGTRSDARIEFGAETGAAEIEYYVADNGTGFDMADAADLFSPFRRLHSERDFPGLGIGLATVRRIVERHGGRLWAVALAGTGATFRFTLGSASSCTSPPEITDPRAVDPGVGW